MNLRWCGAAAAADAAARLGLQGPRYRDEVGAWWTVDAGRWEAWRDDAWHPDQPPDRVEGPAADLPATESPPQAKPDTENTHPELAPALSAAVEGVAAAYRAGLVSSDAAEALLSRLYAVDEKGAVWTAGARSGGWFRFSDGKWQQADAPPDPATTVDAARLAEDGLGAVREAMAAFIQADDLLPEPVTEPWPESAAAPQQAAPWRATHRLPTAGLQAWETPDAGAQPFGSLAGGLEVEVLERSGAWARVSTQGGQAAWVDGRLLVDRGA